MSYIKGPEEMYPGFTTVELPVPTGCNGSLVLAVNAKTSVAGFVQVGVVHTGNTTTTGSVAPSDVQYRLCNSDPLRGNFLGATASWGGGSVRALHQLQGGAVQLEVVLVAAKLFSLQFRCTPNP